MTQTKCCPILHFGSWWSVQRYENIDGLRVWASRYSMAHSRDRAAITTHVLSPNSETVLACNTVALASCKSLGFGWPWLWATMPPVPDATDPIGRREVRQLFTFLRLNRVEASSTSEHLLTGRGGTPCKNCVCGRFATGSLSR